MDITIVISGSSDAESFELLQGLGMPFRTPEGKEQKGAA